MPAFDPARLGRLDAVIGAYDVPGFVSLLARGDEVHAQAFGEYERDTIFRIASLTKPIVAVAALTLVQEAALRLDDPVDRWLPELADRRVLRHLDGPLEATEPADRPVSLRDLLTMRMGFGLCLTVLDEAPIKAAQRDAGLAIGPALPALDPDTFMAELGSMPWLAQPGTRFHYQTAFDALGILLARFAGKSLGEVLAERVLEPLGMRDTGFVAPRSPRMAAIYADAARTAWAPGEAWFAPPMEAGASGLVSTADDLLAFGRMLLAGGAPILAPATYALLATDQITPEQKRADTFFPGYFEGASWGMGIGLVTARTRVDANPGQLTWGGGLGQTLVVDPAADLVAVALAQGPFVVEETQLLQDFGTLAFAALAGQVKGW